ncbi:aminotransferase class III-fold pyridoxal phosphate-dependent enzyme [Lewinella sp. LCG006]|uniref:aminotransferase class III-fold pyridoxal phosphate-dependent enzyme n=1 Tax=Lewinella sp. LCG006 TaxID=3231911 RepID=UPI003460AF4B
MAKTLPAGFFRDIGEITTLVKNHYGLTVTARPLAGEVDLNFYLQTPAGEEYTLKISRPGESRATLEFQAAILEHLSRQTLPWPVPRMVPSLSGKYLLEMKDKEGRVHFVRLQSWVSGRLLDEINPRSPELLQQWGAACGHLNLALADFDHPEAHRFYKWDPSQTLFSRQHLPLFATPAQQEIANYFWDRFEKIVQPQLTSLRTTVNYNDAHELNLLVNDEGESPTICGVIDFGDALHTQLVNELAIACAYGVMGLPDPLTAACQLTRGFHQIRPLTEAEVAVLFEMIAARLLITVASAAHNQQAEPDNEYLQVSEQPAWELLQKWRKISPAQAHYRLREACGWEPVPQRKAFDQWLATQPAIAPVMPWTDKPTIPLDLGVGSLDLGNNENFLTIQPFAKTVDRMLAEAEADFGVGGYGEIRPFYTTDAYQVMGNAGAQWRTVHLGLDVWGVAETPVFAPLAGTVVSAADNAGERDYGPTIILQHEVAPSLTFYTLYGHLSRSSLTNIEVGQTVAAGQQIATIGPAPENGNWPPHLHFQIILDLLDNTQDFPGVAYPDERATWLSNCPDPGLFYPELPQLPQAPLTVKELLSIRQQKLGRSLSISYQEPLHIVRGFGAYLYDTDARRYLDTVNNVAHVGHEHPKVVRAAQRQQAVLNTNTRYLHPNLVQFAEELVATMPEGLSVVHFVNSGSEANELALRMAKIWAGQQDMIALEIGYHGNTGACIDISSYKFAGKGGRGAPPHTHIVPLPDTFRGRYRDPHTAGQLYASHVQEAIERVQSQGRNIAGFIAESIVSCGGQIVLPLGYLPAAYQMVRAAGGLCIADEVQVGFGRVGQHFWGFELQGVVPDIVTLGKPIGNGHPLAAVVTTPAVADAFANGMEFFNTFGGNPVSCAIGRAVLEVIKTENLQANAQQVGHYLRQGLLALQQEFPIIGDVRGPGFFQGIELITDPERLTPAAAQANYLANRMRQRGILMSTDGPLHNVLKIKPPMCFSQENADFLLANMHFVLKENKMQV